MSEQNLNKRYFTIGEVSERFELENHVLRYWEKEFPVLNPEKRSKIRYYQAKDISIISKIKDLLYNQGFTIKGAKAQFAAKIETPDVKTANLGVSTIANVVDELEALVTELGT